MTLATCNHGDVVITSRSHSVISRNLRDKIHSNPSRLPGVVSARYFKGYLSWRSIYQFMSLLHVISDESVSSKGYLGKMIPYSSMSCFSSSRPWKCSSKGYSIGQFGNSVREKIQNSIYTPVLNFNNVKFHANLSKQTHRPNPIYNDKFLYTEDKQWLQSNSCTSFNLAVGSSNQYLRK